MKTYYSKNHPVDSYADPLTLEDKIEIFRDRVQVWHLDVAVEIERQINIDRDQDRPMKHAGLSLVPMLMWYFEMVGEVRNGPNAGSSKNRFITGFADVYPNQLSDADVEKVWTRVRCGLYHNGYMNQGTLFSGDFPEAFQVGYGDNILINPHCLVKTIQGHFTKLILDLNDPANIGLRDTFERQWFIH